MTHTTSGSPVLTHAIFRILRVFSQFLWNLTFIFWDSHEKFSLVLLQMTQLHLKPLKDVKKKNAMFFKLFWYKAFVHWKLKLLNFLVDSVLKHKFCALSRVTVATSNSTYATDFNIIKEIKGDHKNQPEEDKEKIWAPDGIRTHDPPCSRSDALTFDLLRTRWRARVIFVGWTCLLHLAVTQSIIKQHIKA